MAAARYSTWPLTDHMPLKTGNSHVTRHLQNGHMSGNPNTDSDTETSESEDDNDAIELHEQPLLTEKARLALACDDGYVRICGISNTEKLTYLKSVPWVSGRILSVAWSPDGSFIYSGSSEAQHWFISRLDGASVIAGGFSPRNSNVLIISTSSNQVAMCLIDFGLPVDEDNGNTMPNGYDPVLHKFENLPVLFVGHLSRNFMLLLYKPWMEMVETLKTQHPFTDIYGA